MFKKILVPLDGSPESEKALEFAQKAASEQGGAHLILLRVLEVPQVSTWTSVDLIEAHQEEKRIVNDYMDHLKADRFPEGISVEIEIHNGPNPAVAIAETAEQHGVDAIFMSSHGRTGLGRFLLGSVTEKTLRLAHCPVLVVR